MTENETFDHESSRTIRKQWFRYLDAVEPSRQALAGYCHKLTGNIWDAEDLLQDTLLKGFGMTARGDFHGPDSPVRNARAYLFRTATNQFLDNRRRAARMLDNLPEPTAEADVDLASEREAVNKLLQLASAQEFAAMLLKEVYEFSLEEIADFLGTSIGTVKSALSRGRTKMQNETDVPKPDAATRRLVDSYVTAINSGDPDRVKHLMAELVQISVCNVGGGRGREGNWTAKSLRYIEAQAAEVDGESIVLLLREGQLWDVLRLMGEDRVNRLIDYCYAPETLQYVAQVLGLTCEAAAYHQPWEAIESEMVPTTYLPWQP